MTTFLGADTDALRDVSDTFGDRAQRLVELAEELLAAVGAVSWVGPDADIHRAECTAVLGDLTARAGEVTARGRDLLDEAEQQDQASEPGTARGGSGGAWSPDGFDLSDIAPWLVPGKPSTFAERAKDVAEKWFEDKVKERVSDEAEKALDRFLKKIRTPDYWMRGGKKIIPVVPDLIDAAQHAVDGETEEMTFAIYRALLDLSPGTVWMGTVDAASAYLFPLAPDDWMFPGTDQQLNQGSFFDHVEADALENSEDSSYYEMMREGEQSGLEISDRLGIEHEGTRNVFKSVWGFAGMLARGQRDPADPDKPWVFAASEPTQDKIRDLLP
ncbi:hypothetical protein [Brachybacterium sp. J153]|uniref:hypothetical protein n=1 Tax=Brachybacterium sp. J153 TaxID=3116488 RepID=UPI002E760708|nr:hypothetical protein [Brachybacterium sp. J153]MEE1618318.1 hypothetical protein [Brachybacterium sp. J153]